MEEKRRYPRVDVNLPVVLRHRGRLIPATMLNLSCGGMYLKAEGSDISDEAPIEVIFDIDEKKKDVAVTGRVRRVEIEVETTRVGVQFSNVFSDGMKAVQEYLNKNLN